MPLTGRCHCGRNSFEVNGELPDASDGTYRWNTKRVVNHFCSACGCSVWLDSPAFGENGSWDGKTRKVSINARLLDDFEAADWPLIVIDGKNLW